MKRLMFFSTLFFCGICGILFAQNFPPLEPSPEVYAYAEKLSRTASASYWRDLAETALWASSVNTGNQTGACLETITGAVNALASDPNLPSDPKARGEYLLVYMHKNFLKSYSERQTRLDELLRSGRYNCVSSAVFYMILSLSSGLDVGGVMTKDHAFATINTGRELIDVETTNMYGFDPGNRKEFQNSFGKTTGFAYVPVKNYRDRTAINPAELVSLILSNRIAELELRNDFSGAVPLSINREALLSKNTRTDHNSFFEDPHKDMMTRLFNYGAWFIKAGKDDEALAWAEYAGKVFPDEKAWQDFIHAAANNKAVRLIRVRKTAEARAALEAVKERLSADNYKTLDGLVLEAELAEQVNGIKNSGDAEAALSRIGSEWERIPEKSRDELRGAAVLKEAERLGKIKDWPRAIAWIEAAMGEYGGNSLFENALKTMRQNRVGELHNGFAALYNKGDYNGAKAFIEKALEEYPGNRQLTGDLNLVERALARQ
ncbi:MAG: hypothetical protein LBP69_06305 [Treponema sp.]|jgi:tetratricopeptide (TPR) repeat protein|nr:hypothetical protein [Treponema sp.]